MFNEKLYNNIDGGNFRLVNLDIARLTSINSAVLLNFLIYICKKHKSNEIFATYDNIEKYTTLSADEIRTAQKKLKEAGLIEYVRKGIPPKNYYTINIIYINSITQNIPTIIDNSNNKECQSTIIGNANQR